MNESLIDLEASTQEITLVGCENRSRETSNIESFYNGLYCLYTEQLAEAKKFLLKALNGADKVDLSYYEYLSYLGLVEVLLYKSKGGLYRCYNAVRGLPMDPELHLNIAYAEHLLGNRRRSVEAIKKSLASDSKFIHAYQLHRCIGRRKNNNLKRTRPTNNVLGRLLRKKKNRCSEENFDKVFKQHLSKKLDMYVESVVNNK